MLVKILQILFDVTGANVCLEDEGTVPNGALAYIWQSQCSTLYEYIL